MTRIRAFDGLRGLALLMVVGYHIDKSVVPAGYWGVIVFFVLAGYLITRMLCTEVDRNGRVDLGFFYLKRVLRLSPALVVVCLVLLTVGIGRSPAGAAIGYFANYARIGGLDLGLLTHTWFVAVMAHFYLLWPLVIGVTPARHRVRTVAVLALAAVAWRAIAIVALSPGWVYNATDTNAAALLAGCYLGVARPLTSRFAGWSIPGLLGLMFLPVFGEEGAAFLWGGFVALALGVLAIQHAVTRPAWLETPVLVWLGTTSYGLYLWHYVFVRSEISLWAAIPLTIVMGAASWYLLEKPVLRWSVRLDPRTARSEPAAPIRTGHSVPASANRQVASGGRWSTG